MSYIHILTLLISFFLIIPKSTETLFLWKRLVTQDTYCQQLHKICAVYSQYKNSTENENLLRQHEMQAVQKEKNPKTTTTNNAIKTSIHLSNTDYRNVTPFPRGLRWLSMLLKAGIYSILYPQEKCISIRNLNLDNRPNAL